MAGIVAEAIRTLLENLELDALSTELRVKMVEKGAKSVLAAITHGVFTKGSMERIQQSAIERLFVTDSIETQPVEFGDKIEVVSVAPLFGEAIRRIHERESISVLFPD